MSYESTNEISPQKLENNTTVIMFSYSFAINVVGSRSSHEVFFIICLNHAVPFLELIQMDDMVSGSYKKEKKETETDLY